MKRFPWMCLLLLALPLAGCSEDDPTEPIEEPDPYSRLHQINALPDGTAWAVGVEGSTGMLFTNAAGAWGPAADQGPLGSGVAPTGVVPIAADELYLVSGGSPEVDHFSDLQWTAESIQRTPSAAASLQRSGDGLYLLEEVGGMILRREAASWEAYYGVVSPPGRPLAVVVNGEGDFFGVFERTGEEASDIIAEIDSATETYHFSYRLGALAAAGGDTVWAAGRRLARYVGGDWTPVAVLPDTQTVVAIGVPGNGSLTLVCRNGLVYRWQDDDLTLEQEFALIEPLESVAYVRDDLVYGTLNYVDANTGHEVGIVVRYDGTQWNTDFLAPPARP